MKRIWFAVASMAIIIAVCITELIWIENSTDSLKQNIEEAIEEVDNQSENDESSKNDLTELGKNLHSNWDLLHKTFAIFIDHARLEDIDQSVAIIAECLQKKEDSDFYIESAKLKAQLEHLKDTELPTINNIL